MKLFGYFLIACIALLTAAIGIPAYQMGKYFLVLGILVSAIFLCIWIYAIYGPLNAKYNHAKSEIIGVAARPAGLVVIACCWGFFSYRVVEPLLTSNCDLDHSTSARGALFRAYFNHSCTDLGPIGFSLANLPFTLIFSFFLWLALGKPRPWRKA
jgi:hypothetical protein